MNHKLGARIVGFLLVFALGAGLTACGNDSEPPLGASGLFLTVQDAPLDELVKFEITVTSVILTPGNVSALALPDRIELTSLQLTPEVVDLNEDVPPGTYGSVVVTLANPEIKYYDPAAGAVVELTPPMVNSTVTVPLTINVLEGVSQGLLLDFDLAASVVTDAGGNITGIDPVVTASTVDLSTTSGEFEGITGRVVSIDQIDADNGSFVLESFSSCTQFTIEVDTLTAFEDFDDADPPATNELSSLLVNHVVEVDGDIFDTAAIFADLVKFEDDLPEDELEGQITAVTRDGLDQVTQFDMVLQHVGPCINGAPNSDLLTIDVPTDGSVRYRIQDDELVANLALFDDATDLEAGQKVEVEPVEAYDVAAATYTADEIKLGQQTIAGTVASVGSTTFELTPDSALFPDTSITVETSADTEFEDPATGIGDFAPTQGVRVKGLLLRTAAGEFVLVATRVRPE